MYRGEWAGRDAVFKLRKPLPYRLAALDSQLRAQRTAREAEMIHAAKEAGVAAPHIYFASPATSTLVMEFVGGPRMKDAVDEASPRRVRPSFEALGGSIAKLHSAGIMHGDLTTSNVIVRGGAPVFIDFGLALRSSRVEDHAVDLRLVKETITGAHSRVSGPALEALLDGYSGEVDASRFRAVARQLREIERRGRYARVE